MCLQNFRITQISFAPKKLLQFIIIILCRSNMVLNGSIYLYFSRLCPMNGHSIGMCVMPASSYITKRKDPKIRQLYPIQLMKLNVMFAYCANFVRERNVFNASGSVQLTAGLIVSFVVVTAIILWLLRRKFGLAYDDFQLAFMDSLILAIGGGNLRMDNRFERWFFGTLLVSTFFMMSVFRGS